VRLFHGLRTHVQDTNPMQKISAKLRVLLVSFSFLFIVLIIDRLFIDNLYFYLPNETGWDTSPWYNFLHKTKSIKIPTESKSVFITGSSVALYSALPQDIQAELNRSSSQTSYSIDFYSHVAMSPTDLYYYTDHIIKKKPSVVLYLFNPADFQFDYLKNNETGVTFYEIERIQTYPYRNPTRLFYPFSYLKDHFFQLKKKEIFHLLSKAFLKINGYRQFFFDPIDTYIERHWKSNRSYHSYTGAVPDNGIWKQGWTQQTFLIQCEIQKKYFKEVIFTQVPDTKVTIYHRSKIVFEDIFKKSGWHSLHFSIEEVSGVVPLQFSVDKPTSSRLVNPREYGKEYFYGVRLSGNFCKQNLESSYSYIRTDSLDDVRFESMTVEEYRADYFQRIYADEDKRPETYRMSILKKGKNLIKDKPFAVWSEIAMIQKIAEKLKKNNISFVLINNPENPIELEEYANTLWYGGMLSYFKQLEDEGYFTFYDKKDSITDPRMFIDPHHLTYRGSQKMTTEYVEIIKK
jgi:hypothetical protein